MNPSRMLAIALAAAPLSPAGAQVVYSEVRIVQPAYYGLYVCQDQSDRLWDRKAMLDQDKAYNDRELVAIEREGDQLARDLRSLDNRDAAAVAAYNARSDAHNRRVEIHNRRVSDMNSAAAILNGDSADLVAFCNAAPYRRLR